MELEFKHIQPYMLSNLKLQYFGDLVGRLGGYMEGMNHNPVRVCYNGQDNYNIDAIFKDEIFLNLKDIKPILKPITDLDKLVYNEFEKYNNKEKYDEEIIDLFSEEIGVTDLLEITILDTLPYRTVDYIFRNNYDYFGLIEKGLAVDYNSVVSV